MTQREDPQEETAASTPQSAEEAKASAPAEESGKRSPDQFHAREVELLKESLAAEGEGAYQRWGLPFFHSLGDEEIESQRASLGFPLHDALDHYNRGCLLAGREDYAGAIKAFAKAFELDSHLAEALFNRALAQEKSGNAQAARQSWQEYLDKFGANEDVDEVKQHLSAPATA